MQVDLGGLEDDGATDEALHKFFFFFLINREIFLDIKSRVHRKTCGIWKCGKDSEMGLADSAKKIFFLFFRPFSSEQSLAESDRGKK